MSFPALPSVALAAALLASSAMALDDQTLVSVTAPFPAPEKLPAQTALPNPLQTFLGHPVKTAEAWKTQRAPELRRLFQHYMYGQMPRKPQRLQATVVREDKTALGGKATLREIEVRTTSPDTKTHLLLLVPNARTGPVPVFLGINFNGNHTLLPDPQISLPDSWMPSGRLGVGEDHRASAEGRGKETDAWAIEETINRGYAFAGFYHGDIVPDQPALAAERLAQFAQESDGDAPATIACWAWGFSRMIDHLVTEPELDPARIAVVGHSRNGKTALLAAAMDERIALAIPSQSGCGGSAPNRMSPEMSAPGKNGRPTAETVAVINKNFPHWFCANFKAFNDAVAKLPFDQHELIALCAPRPVLLSNAVEDLWANPAGQFDMLQAAHPVYQLIASSGLGAEKMPEPGMLLASRLGYFIRPGKHSMTSADWKVWLDYADIWLKGNPATAACCDPAGRNSAVRSRTALLRK